ncbi:MAG: methyltransferase domain-containing protein [Gaiellaceae bacterium]
MRLAFIGRAPAEYDRRFMETMAREYLDRTPWTELRLAAVRDLVEPAPGDRVLDLGCAAGAITHYLSSFGCETIGIDSEPLAVETASSLFPKLRFQQADVTALPYGDGSFDKAVAADLVEHLDDSAFAAMLAEANRVLVRGGTLSVYTPNRRHLVERLKARELVLAQNPTHIGVRGAQELAEAFGWAGFVVDRQEWRASFFRGLRTVERIAGQRLDLFRYRLCVRGRKSL